MTGRGWLIYHPKRQVSRFGALTVYHDSLSGNQDPYVWSRRFLHTACHITQMSPEVGDVNFWISGDTFPAFSGLWCDLVFVVQEKAYWQHSNSISADDPVIDTPEAFADHYAWMPKEHPFRLRRRFTLKANPATSFQPQQDDGSLIDLVPLLTEVGVGLDGLRTGLRAGFQSKPLRLPDGTAPVVYQRLREVATVRTAGEQLEEIRRSAAWRSATSAP